MKLVFVSSTFKDMQFERDMLQTFAIPTLNAKLREYGEKAYFGDLRWGVNTTDLDSDEGSRKVLKVCLDQIDHCKPYMIVLIGERYGWIPAQELIDEACVLKGIEKIRDISVTELEIDYGALLNPEYEGRILFYFRTLNKSGMTECERLDYEAESELHLQKVESLKQRILEIYPDQIRYYDAAWDASKKQVVGLEGFLAQVQADLCEVFCRDLEREHSLPWQERCMRSAQRYFEEAYKTLVPADNSTVAYVGSEAAEGATFVYVTGKDGSGKSAAVISAYGNDTGEKLAFSFGLDAFSRDAFDFERVLIYKAEELLGYPHKEYDEAELDAVVPAYLASLEEPLGIYVDNADKDFLQFLARLDMDRHDSDEPAELGAYFMIALQRELPYYPFFSSSAKLVMGDLSAEDAEAVLDGIVKSNHKELSDAVKERILSKNASRSAAYLKSIVKRLMILDSEDFAAIREMGDGMESINRYMISIVDATADGQYEILGELIEEAKERINRVFVDRLLGIFAHVPVGLCIGDIRGLFEAYGMEFNDLDFSLAVQLLEDVLSYHPDTRLYKLKNKEIEACICKHATVPDAVLTAEYMLSRDELRPYAFRAAVLDATPAYLCTVLKRSGITDITDSVRLLLERGRKDRATELLMAVAADSAFCDVRLLPSFAEFERKDHLLLYTFLGELADACSVRLAKGEHSLLGMALEARFSVAEYALEIDPQITVNVLVGADELLRRYAHSIEASVIHRMYLLMLKAVNKTKSEKLFDTYIEGEAFLQVFERADELTRMKAYAEFSEIAGVFDEALQEFWYDKAVALAVDADVSACESEDFVCLTRLLQDPYWILLGKVFEPFDLGLLRAEIEQNLHDRQADLADTAEQAAAIMLHTAFKPDCIRYWRALLYRLAREDDRGQPFDETSAEIYLSLTESLTKDGLASCDYVDILHFASIAEGTAFVERLLDVASCEGNFEAIVSDLIRYGFLEAEPQKLLALRQTFCSMRDDFAGADRIAALTVEAYFEMLTEEE